MPKTQLSCLDILDEDSKDKAHLACLVAELLAWYLGGENVTDWRPAYRKCETVDDDEGDNGDLDAVGSI